MSKLWTPVGGLASLALVVTAVSPRAPVRAAGAVQQDYRSWKDYGSGADHSKYTRLDQLTKSNWNKLEVAGTYPTGDNPSYLFNPIVVDNIMYVLAKGTSL